MRWTRKRNLLLFWTESTGTEAGRWGHCTLQCCREKRRGSQKCGYIKNDHNIKPPDIICRLGWQFVYHPLISHSLQFLLGHYYTITSDIDNQESLPWPPPRIKIAPPSHTQYQFQCQLETRARTHSERLREAVNEHKEQLSLRRRESLPEPPALRLPTDLCSH